MNWRAIACGLVAAAGVGLILGVPIVIAQDDFRDRLESPTSKARLGQVAPDFKLKDLFGHDQSLAAYKGRVVVLEWFNPSCPYVAKHHEKHPTMRELQKKWAHEGLVWLTIASGKSARSEDLLRRRQTAWQVLSPILLDADGRLAQRYGARTTPHMFIVDAAGKLVYSGAIDDNADRESIGRINYVDRALRQLFEGEPVDTPSTFPYGCKVEVDPYAPRSSS